MIKKISAWIFSLAMVFGLSLSAQAGWGGGTISQFMTDFRGDASGCGYNQIYLLLSSGEHYSFTDIACNHSDKWPFVYGQIMAAYNNNKRVAVEYRVVDGLKQVRYFQIYNE